MVEFLDDEAEEPRRRPRAIRSRALRRARQQATDRELEHEELAELDSYGMAGTVEFELDAKQELLELRSENDRMRLLAALLQEAIERLELVERAQARARSNGKVRFG